MAYTTETLVPSRPNSGLYSNGSVEVYPMSYVGVDDDSDATWMEIHAEYGSSDVLSATFAPVAPGQSPVAMHMQIRAKDNAAYTAPGFVKLRTDYYKAGSASAYDNWSLQPPPDPAASQLGNLVSGYQATVDWLPFYFLGAGHIDTTDPASSGWLQIGEDAASYAGYWAWDALTTTGLRFDLWADVTSNLEPRRAYFDIYEVRLVLAYQAPASGRRPPRGPRLYPVKNVLHSPRRGPGAMY